MSSLKKMIIVISIVTMLIFIGIVVKNMSMSKQETLLTQTRSLTPPIPNGGSLPCWYGGMWKDNYYHVWFASTVVVPDNMYVLRQEVRVGPFTYYPSSPGFVSYKVVPQPASTYACGSISTARTITVTVTYIEPGPSCTVPEQPTGLHTDSITDNSVTIGWNPNAEDNISGYGIWLDGIFREQTAYTTYVVGGLTPDTNYVIGVEAINDCGLHSTIASINVRTAIFECENPIVPINFGTLEITQTSIRVRWNPNPESNLSAYHLYLDGEFDGQVLPSLNTYTYTDLVSNTQYNLQLRALNNCGGVSGFTSLTVRTSSSVTPSSETNCDDGMDNDGDGLVDCEDDDCEGLPECGDVDYGLITGTVRDSEGNPLENARVEIQLKYDLTDENGRYSLQVDGGSYEVRASKAGYRTVSQLVTVQEGFTVIQDFVLSDDEGTGSISGRVANANPAIAEEFITIEGATIVIKGVPLPGATVSTDEYSSVTDGNGNFLISEIPEGTYNVTASKEGYESLTLSNLEVVAGETTLAYFQLAPLADKGEISGKISDKDTGEAIPNVKVTVEGNGINEVTYSLSTGTFAIGNLDPDTYTIKFEKNGYKTLESSIEVDPGVITNVSVFLAKLDSESESDEDSSVLDPEEGGGWSFLPLDFRDTIEKIGDWIVDHKIPLLLLIILVLILLILWKMNKKIGKMLKKKSPKIKKTSKKGKSKVKVQKVSKQISKVSKKLTKNIKSEFTKLKKIMSKQRKSR